MIGSGMALLYQAWRSLATYAHCERNNTTPVRYFKPNQDIRRHTRNTDDPLPDRGAVFNLFLIALMLISVLECAILRASRRTARYGVVASLSAGTRSTKWWDVYGETVNVTARR